MNYDLTTPCRQCPFLQGSGFTWQQLCDHASGAFPCHKVCDVDDEGVFVQRPNNKTPHCAGALIFNEKLGTPHQLMRIAERLGLYDRSKLNMAAPVVSAPTRVRTRPRRTE